jgi:hypothetical protein
MAKVEELNKSMGPVHALGDKLKELKSLLDVMEAAAGLPPPSTTSSVVAKLKKAGK